MVILLLAILVAGLLKSHAEILRQLAALGVTEEGAVTVGTPQTRPKTTGFEKAPSNTLSGVGLDGAEQTLSLVHGRGNTLVAFLSSGCLSCQTFWTEFQGDFELPMPGHADRDRHQGPGVRISVQADRHGAYHGSR